MLEAKFIKGPLNVIFLSQACTGFTYEALVKHQEFFKQHVTEKPRSYYRCGDNLKPDEWFDGVQVGYFSQSANAEV